MSRVLSRLQATLLAVAVLTGLSLAALGLFAVGSRGWYGADALVVRVGFAEIKGVEPGTRVRVQGVDAGEVTEVQPPDSPGGPVILHLRLKGSFRPLLRTDARVQIASEGMIGGKVVEIHPGSAGAPPIPDDAILASQPTGELSDLIDQASQAVKSLADEKAHVREVVDNANKLLVKGQGAAASIEQVAEGVKRAPVIRNYVEDPKELLYRPNCERNRQVFAEAELFEPGEAMLTSQGRQRLNNLGPWLLGLSKHKGAEVVVVAYADPRNADPELARTLTHSQSKSVCSYLKDQGAVYKKLWLFSRDVKALGLGIDPPPAKEKEPLPPARVEVLVFVPQN
jgi:phospholipid/cholesterol/gamma-HCH transport system substrate-binding protein